eukprot:g26765.t1
MVQEKHHNTLAFMWISCDCLYPVGACMWCGGYSEASGKVSITWLRHGLHLQGTDETIPLRRELVIICKISPPLTAVGDCTPGSASRSKAHNT